MIDFCLKANSLISKQKLPPIYHSWPWGRSLLLLSVPSLFCSGSVSVSISQMKTTWCHTVIMCEGRERKAVHWNPVFPGSEVYFCHHLIFNSQSQGMWTNKGFGVGRGIGVHVIIPRVGPSFFCPALILCPALHALSPIKVLPSGETDHQPRLDAWDKCLGLVHWDDPEGWDGEEGGRGVHGGEHM